MTTLGGTHLECGVGSLAVVAPQEAWGRATLWTASTSLSTVELAPKDGGLVAPVAAAAWAKHHQRRRGGLCGGRLAIGPAAMAWWGRRWEQLSMCVCTAQRVAAALLLVGYGGEGAASLPLPQVVVESEQLPAGVRRALEAVDALPALRLVLDGGGKHGLPAHVMEGDTLSLPGDGVEVRRPLRAFWRPL
eukprot:COSAG01_NODE_2253_length_8073_cov_14.930524_2_plen_190_part_00